MPLGREVGLVPSDIVLDRDPVPLPKKGAEPPPIFGPCLVSPNGWMDQDGTWHEVLLATNKFSLCSEIKFFFITKLVFNSH